MTLKEAADELNRFVQKNGNTLEEYVALVYAAKKAGEPTSTLDDIQHEYKRIFDERERLKLQLKVAKHEDSIASNTPSVLYTNPFETPDFMYMIDEKLTDVATAFSRKDKDFMRRKLKEVDFNLRVQQEIREKGANIHVRTTPRTKI